MKEKENLEQTIKQCVRQLRHLPRGKLVAQTKGNNIYYLKRLDGDTLYLPKGDPEIVQLKNRHLAEAVLKNANENLDVMNYTLQHFKTYDPNELAAAFSKSYQGISVDIIQALGFAYTLGFETAPQQWDKHPENLKYTTIGGAKRRSKSELIIDDIYKSLNIRQQYEKGLRFSDGHEINPDFSAFSELIMMLKFHEHIGDVADPQKMGYNIWKFKHYVHDGIYPFDRLLYTFDKPDGSIDAEEIAMLIKMFMQ